MSGNRSCFTGREGPAQTIEGQAITDVRVLRDIIGVVEVDELEVANLPIQGENGQQEGCIDPKVQARRSNIAPMRKRGAPLFSHANKEDTLPGAFCWVFKKRLRARQNPVDCGRRAGGLASIVASLPGPWHRSGTSQLPTPDFLLSRINGNHVSASNFRMADQAGVDPGKRVTTRPAPPHESSLLYYFFNPVAQFWTRVIGSCDS